MIETRSGTVCDVVEKFMRAVSKFYEHLDENKSKDFASILTYEDSIHGSKFNYLQTFVDCFEPIRHAQTKRERTSSPTLHLIFSLHEKLEQKLKQQLTNVSFGDLDVETLKSEPTAASVTVLLQKLEDMKTSDLGLAASILNPGMRNLLFLVCSGNRDSSMTAAKAIIRRMIRSVIENNDVKEVVPSVVRGEIFFGNSLLGKD